MPRFIPTASPWSLAALWLLSSLALAQSPPNLDKSNSPHWIWSRNTSHDTALSPTADESCRLEHTFKPNSSPDQPPSDSQPISVGSRSSSMADKSSASNPIAQPWT